jgi:rhamnosyltransferase
MLKIAGVTILYNPKEDVIENILSYLDQIEILYVIDNSEKIEKEIIQRIKILNRVKILENLKNIGIAAALNKSAEHAIIDGYDILLMMDQDSKVSENFVEEMIKMLHQDTKIGLISPFVIHRNNPKNPPEAMFENISIAITSGSIMRLSVFEDIGKFEEKLFIDYVDHEYCLRMRSHGYKIVQLNSVFIFHDLGHTECRNFLFFKVFPTNHSPIRWYYRTRNRLYVRKKFSNTFKDYVKLDKLIFQKELLKILLYERDKIEKIKMMIRGYIDFKKNIFGKFDC